MGSQPPALASQGPRGQPVLPYPALVLARGVPTGSAVPLALLSHSASLLCTPCKGPSLFLHWGSDSEHLCVCVCVCRKDLHFQSHLSSILKILTPGSGLHSRQMPVRPQNLVLFPVSDLAQIPCHTRGAIWLGIRCPCQTFCVEGCGAT